MSRTDNDSYRPRHFGRDGDSSKRSNPSDPQIRRASSLSDEESIEYRSISLKGSKYAAEVGEIDRKPAGQSITDKPRTAKIARSVKIDSVDEGPSKAEVNDSAVDKTAEKTAVTAPEAPAARTEAKKPEKRKKLDLDVAPEKKTGKNKEISWDISSSAGAVSIDAIERKPEEHEESEYLVKHRSSVDDDDDDYFVKKPRKKRWRKVLISVVSVILVLALALVGTYFVMAEMGRRSIHNNEGMEIVTPTADESGKDIIAADKYGRIITYDGVSYTYNDDIVAITFIGIDNGTGPDKDAKMADAVYILTVNAKTGETKFLGIPRDVMTDVDVYSDEGEYFDTRKLQITYSYNYHSATKTRGDNTNKSVSRLFFGLPAKNYFAINLDAVVALNDAVGGVTLTSSFSFKSPEDGRMINEGDTVTLHGKEAEVYVRRRDITEIESNRDRMQRQQEYIKAFLGTIFDSAKSDISVVSDLYSTIRENSDSNLTLTELTYMASIALTKLNSSGEIEYINLKGELVHNDYVETHVSDEEIMRTMLDIFYTPMSTTMSSENTSASALASESAETTAEAAAIPKETTAE